MSSILVPTAGENRPAARVDLLRHVSPPSSASPRDQRIIGRVRKQQESRTAASYTQQQHILTCNTAPEATASRPDDAIHTREII